MKKKPLKWPKPVKATAFCHIMMKFLEDVDVKPSNKQQSVQEKCILEEMYRYRSFKTKLMATSERLMP